MGKGRKNKDVKDIDVTSDEEHFYRLYCPNCREIVYLKAGENQCPKCHKAWSFWFVRGRINSLMVFSEQEQFYQSSGKCPYCFRSIRYRVIEYVALGGKTHRCPECHKIWNTEIDLMLKKEPPVPLSIISVSGIEETGEEREYICDQNLGIIDNSESSATSEKTFEISKELSRSYIIEKEKAETKGMKVNIGYHIANFEVEAEKAIREKYSSSEETKLTYKQQATFTVPPRKKVQLILTWYRIWRYGKIKLNANFLDNTIGEIEVPFKQVVGASFDQKTVDLKET